MKMKLGQILVEAGAIDEFQLKSAIGFQNKWGGRLGKVLVEHRFLTEEALLKAVQEQTRIPVVNVAGRTFPDYLIKLVPHAIAEKHHLVPISLEPATAQGPEMLIVAMADPTNLEAIEELSAETGRRVKVVLAGEIAIQAALDLHYAGAPVGQDADLSSEDLGRLDIDSNEMQVVQGTLEQPVAAQPVPAPATSPPVLDDPFAELDAIGAAPEPVLVGTPAQAQPPAVADPFSELDDLAVNSVGASVPGSQDLPHEAPVSVADPFSELDDLALAATERAIDPLPASVGAESAPGNQNLPPEAPMSVADPFSELDDLAIATTEPSIVPLSVPVAADPVPVPAPPADPFAELDSLSASAPSSSFDGPGFDPEDVGGIEIEEMELEELDIEEAEGGEFPSFEQDQVMDLSDVRDQGESAEAAPLDSFPAPATPEELAAVEATDETETGRVGELTFDFSESEEEGAIASLELDESPPASASPDALGATLDEAAIGSVDDDVETAPGISVIPDVAQQDESAVVSQVEQVVEVADAQKAGELDDKVADVDGLSEDAPPEMPVEEETPVSPPEMPPPSPSAMADEGPPSPSAMADEGPPSPSAMADEGPPSPSAMADEGPPSPLAMADESSPVEKSETKESAGSDAMAALLSRVGLGKDKVEKQDQASSDAAEQMDALVESVSGEFDAVPEPAEAAEDEAISFRQELVAAGLNLEDPAIRMVLSVLVRRGVCEQELLDSLNEED
ncbi:MAG: hypothetical protein JRF33_11090 [Deltaproteobacteria bacterium]|nr:hypothetical protein [Deltaproteobacteria bacterium]